MGYVCLIPAKNRRATCRLRPAIMPINCREARNYVTIFIVDGIRHCDQNTLQVGTLLNRDGVNRFCPSSFARHRGELLLADRSLSGWPTILFFLLPFSFSHQCGILGIEQPSNRLTFRPWNTKIKFLDSLWVCTMRQLKHHEQKLLKRVDFLNYKQDQNHRDLQVIRRYHIQHREDYFKYTLR